METLSLNNTLSRKKEPFRSKDQGRVLMFTCGPSVYSRAHIGNYRTFLYEDVLERYLEHLGYGVDRMINFTDVEDKAIEEAQTNGVSLKELTAPIEEHFFRETRLLSIRLPGYIPRSSTSVEQAALLIKILLQKGYAYYHGNDIFYDPLKYEGFGRLYGVDMSRWPAQRRRFSRDTYPGHRWNLGDFILWHGGQGDHIYWNTDIGIGRPSWNVQDAAMITKHFGYRIDIACGGLDNLYRHHDYTLALVESVSGEAFCPYWLHGGHVLANGTKMSKSRGNVIYLENLLQMGFKPNFIRFALIYNHYRKNLDLCPDYLENTSARLQTFIRMAEALTDPDEAARKERSDATEPSMPDLCAIFRECMNNDLDVKGAFDRLFDILSQWMEIKAQRRFDPRASRRVREELEKIDSVLQIFDSD